MTSAERLGSGAGRLFVSLEHTLVQNVAFVTLWLNYYIRQQFVMVASRTTGHRAAQTLKRSFGHTPASYPK